MTEETRPGFLANSKMGLAGPARNLNIGPGPHSPRLAFGPARLTPLVYNTVLVK